MPFIPKFFWESAKRIFKKNPTLVKLKKSVLPTPYSFINVENKLYAMESGYLGTGSFGKVKRGISEDDQICAIKIEGIELNKQNPTENKIGKMLGFLKGMVERDLGKYVQFWKKDNHRSLITNKKVYKVINYYEGEDLAVALYQKTKLTYTQKLIIAIKCAQEILKLHQLGIIHADIKPPNFMGQIDHQKIQINVIDFGLSLLISKGASIALSQPAGTRRYSAPEIYQGKFSFSSDIYALGIMFKEDLQLSTDIYGMMINSNALRRPPLAFIIEKLFRILEKRPDLDLQTKKWINYKINPSTADNKNPLPTLFKKPVSRNDHSPKNILTNLMHTLKTTITTGLNLFYQKGKSFLQEKFRELLAKVKKSFTAPLQTHPIVPIEPQNINVNHPPTSQVNQRHLLMQPRPLKPGIKPLAQEIKPLKPYGMKH